jgi:hypothetical protein
MALRIHKSDVDGQTGMLRLKVQAEEKDADGRVTRGPVETIAIFPQALANVIGANNKTPAEVTRALRAWMQPRHAEMLQRKHMIEAVSATAAQMNNVLVEFD